MDATISVNGETRPAVAGATVVDLLRALGLDGGRVAIERNLEILPRQKWPDAHPARRPLRNRSIRRRRLAFLSIAYVFFLAVDTSSTASQSIPASPGGRLSGRVAVQRSGLSRAAVRREPCSLRVAMESSILRPRFCAPGLHDQLSGTIRRFLPPIAPPWAYHAPPALRISFAGAPVAAVSF